MEFVVVDQLAVYVCEFSFKIIYKLANSKIA